MLGLFKNLTKAALNVAVTPVAIVTDVVKLPVTAFEDRSPFEQTSKRLKDANECLDAALDPKED